MFSDDLYGQIHTLLAGDDGALRALDALNSYEPDKTSKPVGVEKVIVGAQLRGAYDTVRLALQTKMFTGYLEASDGLPRTIDGTGELRPFINTPKGRLTVAQAYMSGQPLEAFRETRDLETVLQAFGNRVEEVLKTKGLYEDPRFIGC